MFLRTTQEERAFEKRVTASERDRKLDSDVIRKVAEDDGYRFKVALIESALDGERGWVLSIGSGTCGEDEYLSTRGYKIISTDIDETALAVSKARSQRFGRERFEYASCDGQKLSFADASLSFALFNESLHHLPDPAAGLDEAFRVLKPGGRLFLFEPYAYDPWRRISEVRDYFKGTIETSFSVRRLTKMLKAAGFTVARLDRVVYISKEKLPRLGPLHRAARIAYYSLRKAFPNLFGMIALVAEKPAAGETPAEGPAEYTELLRCPMSGSRLLAADGGFVTDDRAHRLFYPAIDGIPILIADDSRVLAEDEWAALVARTTDGR